MKWMMLASLVFGLQEKALEPPRRAESLSLTLSLEKADLVLNEDIQIEAKLENTSDKAVEVPELLFDRRSLSLHAKVTVEGAKSFEYAYSIVRPDAHVADRLPLERITLGPKKNIVTYLKLPTLLPGTVEVRVKYAYGEKGLESSAVQAKVSAAQTGSKLAAIVETSKGSLVMDLLPEMAPASCSNFVTLAKRGFFNGLAFHRVIRGAWIQTGCPYQIGVGGPGYALQSEKDREGQKQRKYEKGTVGLSEFEKAGYTGSQFFITLGRVPTLDGKYTIIGHIADTGTLDAIGKVDTDKATDRPKEDILVKSIMIVTKG